MHDKTKERILDLLADIAGGLLYALEIYTFAKTAKNLLQEVYRVLRYSVSYMGASHWYYDACTQYSRDFVELSFTWKNFFTKEPMLSMIFCTVWVDFILPLTPAYSGSPLLAALYSGVFLGAGLAIVYARFLFGGTDFLTVSVKVIRPHLSLGAATMIIDLVIILMGWPVFGRH